MNAMVGGLSGSKMSSSDPDSKVDLLDSSDAVQSKLKKAFCEEGNVVDNPILQFLKAVVFPIKSLTASPQSPWKFTISRPEKYGGNIEFATYEELHTAFLEKGVHPGDLKAGAATALNELLEPIRQAWQSSPELQELALKAYPPPKPKLVSDVSKLGTISFFLVQCSLTNHTCTPLTTRTPYRLHCIRRTASRTHQPPY